MDGRRPRIKPTVNLQPKRKIDSVKSQTKTSSSSSSSSISKTSPNLKLTNENNQLQASNDITEPKYDADKKIREENNVSNSQQNPFKKPPDIRNIPLDNVYATDLLNSDQSIASMVSSPIVENQYQPQQQQQSLNAPSQQLLKHRQRIKPTPFFGSTRRSSIQGNSINDIDDEHHRRQRHLSEQGGHQIGINVEKFQNSSSERNVFTGGESNLFENSGNITTGSSTLTTSQSNRNQIPSRYRKVSSSEDVFHKPNNSVKRTSLKYNNSKPVEKSAMKMLDFIYYNPSTNPMNSECNEQSVESTIDTNAKDENMNIGSENTQTTAVPPAVPVPQLKLGPNGEMILDEQSLVIETTAEKEGRKNLLKSKILYLDDNTGNNGFYKRQKRTKEWTSEETIKFYRCLHTVGTDFSLMLTLFPDRTRRDLKLKFKKEERTNLGLVNKALLYPKAFNVDELRKELEKDEKEYEKNVKWKKMQTEKVLKEMKKTTKKQVKNKISRAARTLVGGDEVYQTENIINKCLKNSKDNTQKVLNDYRKNEVNDDEITDEQMIFETLVEDDDDDDGGANDNENTFEDKNSHNFTSFDDVNQQQESIDIKPNLYLNDVDKVLTNLANGSLVLVSSVDPNLPSKTINEIYVMCKGQLSEKPLELPDEVINCVISEAFM